MSEANEKTATSVNTKQLQRALRFGIEWGHVGLKIHFKEQERIVFTLLFPWTLLPFSLIFINLWIKEYAFYVCRSSVMVFLLSLLWPDSDVASPSKTKHSPLLSVHHTGSLVFERCVSLWSHCGPEFGMFGLIFPLIFNLQLVACEKVRGVSFIKSLVGWLEVYSPLLSSQTLALIRSHNSCRTVGRTQGWSEEGRGGVQTRRACMNNGERSAVPSGPATSSQTV